MIPSFPVPPRRLGATLIEVLVVISVIGILIGLLLSAVQQVRSAAMRADCQNRLRQISLGFHSYHAANNRFPKAVDWDPFGQRRGSISGISWLTSLLPFVERHDLWESARVAVRQDAFSWHDPPHSGISTVVKTYICPSDSRVASAQTDPDGIKAAYTSYLGVAGEYQGRSNGILPKGREYQPTRISDVRDGSSNTIAVGERPPSARLDSGWWYCSHWNAYSHDFILWAEMYAEKPECIPSPQIRFQFGPGRIANQCDMYHWDIVKSCG